MKNILIIGSSGHAKVVIDIIEKESKYQILGLLSRDQAAGEKVFDYEILGKQEELGTLLKEHTVNGIFVAVGDNFMRSKVSNFLAENHPQLEIISTIHPSAIIGRDVNIGKGTVIMAGAVINPSSSIGDFCIINTNASLDHDCIMGDFSSLAPGVITGGDCQIGEYSAIGIGATLLHGIQIGKETVIGATSLVNKNIPPSNIAYGIPAKVIRKREAGEKYL